MAVGGGAFAGVVRSVGGGDAGGGNSSPGNSSLSSIAVSGRGLAGVGAGGSFLAGSGAGVGMNTLPDLRILSSSKLTSLSDNCRWPQGRDRERGKEGREGGRERERQSE